MGRLIDADSLKDRASEYTPNNDEYGRFCEIIDAEPTAYDLDKVVEQLEAEQEFWNHSYDKKIGKEKARSYAHAIEIVETGGNADLLMDMDRAKSKSGERIPYDGKWK